MCPDVLPLSIATQYALWYRPGPRSPWKMIASGESESELTLRIGSLPRGGDWVTLRVGENPNARRPAFHCF